MYLSKLRIFIYSCCVLVFFTACSSPDIKAQYYSTLLPLYDFDTNAPTVIKADPWDLASSYYANIALLNFKQRGFNNIYLSGEIQDSYARNIIYIQVSKAQSSPDNYKYSFIAQGTCNVVDGVPHCSVDSKNDRANKQAEISTTDTYQVTFDWYDIYKQRRVLYVGGVMTSPSHKFSDLKIYTSLISQTVSRIDFKKPTHYIYQADSIK